MCRWLTLLLLIYRYNRYLLYLGWLWLLLLLWYWNFTKEITHKITKPRIWIIWSLDQNSLPSSWWYLWLFLFFFYRLSKIYWSTLCITVNISVVYVFAQISYFWRNISLFLSCLKWANHPCFLWYNFFI